MASKDKEELQQAWFKFLKTSSNNLEDVNDGFERECNHIHGFDKRDCNDFEISKLQKITAQRILDYDNDIEKTSIQTLEANRKDFIVKNGSPLNLLSVIKNQSSKNIMTLAAEFKRASPSKGPINASLRAGEQAVIYSNAGASIISVLTESRGFMGKLHDLTEARMDTSKLYSEVNGNGDAVTMTTRPAILRKDFIVTEYQILEAVASGADTVLLIVAILPACLLRKLIDYCRTLNMEPLVEVHTTLELEVAIKTGSKVIGVNNRNLHTFSLDLETTDKVAHFMSSRGIKFDHRNVDDTDYCLCALSGMSSAEDVDRYRNVGVGMVLIGESLMRATDPNQAIKSLCLDPSDYQLNSTSLTAGAAYVAGTQIIKICGITNAEDAVYACQQGASLIGVIFAPKSKRKVTAEQAKAVVNAVRKFGERDQRITFPSSSKNNGSSSPTRVLRQNALRLQQIASKKPLVVGVFQNQSKDFINNIIEQTGIDLIQLHGQEGMEAANSSNYNDSVSAIRVVDIPAQTDDSESAALEDSILSSITSDPFAILLDTTVKHGVIGGGTGKTFDWNIVEKIQNKGLPVIIAGGLTPHNIDTAVMTVRPFGIDVSSGVEEKPGKKDLDKVNMFITGAKNAAMEGSKGI